VIAEGSKKKQHSYSANHESSLKLIATSVGSALRLTQICSHCRRHLLPILSNN